MLNETGIKQAAKLIQSEMKSHGHQVKLGHCQETAAKLVGLSNFRTAKAVLSSQTESVTPQSSAFVLLKAPLTNKQIRAIQDEHGYFTVFLEVDLSELMVNVNDLNDRMDEWILADGGTLSDINYKAVGVNPDNTNSGSYISGNVIIKVTAEVELNDENSDKTVSGTTDILQHQIKWWFSGGEYAPGELGECDIEHIEKMIREGYNQGELNVSDTNGDSEYRGWWLIAKA